MKNHKMIVEMMKREVQILKDQIKIQNGTLKIWIKVRTSKNDFYMRKILDENYKNDKRHGMCSGWLYVNGQKMYENEYKNGKLID